MFHHVVMRYYSGLHQISVSLHHTVQQSHIQNIDLVEVSQTFLISETSWDKKKAPNFTSVIKVWYRHGWVCFEETSLKVGLYDSSLLHSDINMNSYLAWLDKHNTCWYITQHMVFASQSSYSVSTFNTHEERKRLNATWAVWRFQIKLYR